jgi:hypothetical protein
VNREPAPKGVGFALGTIVWRQVLGWLTRTVYAGGKEGDMRGTDSSESQDPTQGASALRTDSAARNRRRLVWAAVGLAVVCVLGLRVFGVVGPKPCTSCHDLGVFRAETQASPHASVDCRRCHQPPGVVGEAVFALQRPLHAYFPRTRPADREAAAVPDQRCSACHEKALQGVVVSNGIRMNHASCAATAACTECHSSIAHGKATRWVRSYDMDVCLECHMASDNIECDLCHEGRDTAVRVKSSAFAVTHGPKWKSTHGMGDTATCTVCHTAGDCADCHGAGVPHEPKFVDVHASYAAQPNARCASCHKDAFCNSCHGTEMPHPAEFTPRHSTEAEKQPGLCTRCHAASDCTNCHLKHVHPGGASGKPVPPGGGR